MQSKNKIQTRPIEDFIGQVRSAKQAQQKQINLPIKEAEKLAAIENSYAMANSRYNSNYLRNARNPSDFVNYQRKLKNNRFYLLTTLFASDWVYCTLR